MNFPDLAFFVTGLKHEGDTLGVPKICLPHRRTSMISTDPYRVSADASGVSTNASRITANHSSDSAAHDHPIDFTNRPESQFNRASGRCATVLMHGCQDGLFATLPAKLASLGTLLGGAALMEKTELAAPLFVFVGTGVAFTGAASLGMRIARNQMDERGDIVAKAVIVLSAMTAGAAAIVALGVLPPGLLAIGFALAGVAMLSMQTRCGPASACLRTVLFLGVVATGLAAAAAFETRYEEQTRAQTRTQPGNDASGDIATRSSRRSPSIPARRNAE